MSVPPPFTALCTYIGDVDRYYEIDVSEYGGRQMHASYLEAHERELLYIHVMRATVGQRARIEDEIVVMACV